MPTTSIIIYIASTILQLTVTQKAWFGWTAFAITSVVCIGTNHFIQRADIYHARVVQISSACKQEQAAVANELTRSASGDVNGVEPRL
jgi:hypothetical protein